MLASRFKLSSIDSGRRMEIDFSEGFRFGKLARFAVEGSKSYLDRRVVRNLVVAHCSFEQIPRHGPMMPAVLGLSRANSTEQRKPTGRVANY